MPTILIRVCEIATTSLPRLVKELKIMNELKAIEIRHASGLMSVADTNSALNEVMGND